MCNTDCFLPRHVHAQAHTGSKACACVSVTLSFSAYFSWAVKAVPESLSLSANPRPRLEAMRISCRCLGLRNCWRDERPRCWLQVSSYDQLFFLSCHKTTSLFCWQGGGRMGAGGEKEELDCLISNGRWNSSEDEPVVIRKSRLREADVGKREDAEGGGFIHAI